MDQGLLTHTPVRSSHKAVGHIAFVCRNFLTKDLGGIEVYTHRMARVFQRRGLRVSVVCSWDDKKRTSEADPHAADEITVRRVYLREDPFPGFWRLDQWYPLDDRRFAVGAASETVRLQPDVVEATDYFREGYGLSRLQRRPAFVFRIHGWLFNRRHEDKEEPRPRTVKERVQHAMIQSCLSRADFITVVSQYSLNVARRLWRIPQERVAVVHNGVDADVFVPSKTPSESTVKRIVFVGRFLPHKGIYVLEEAMRRILNRHKDVIWVVIGAEAPEATGGSWIRPLLKEFGPRIEWHTQLPQHRLIPFLQDAWVSVVPSLYEPFGLTALEAMACGCPVIASKTGGLKEFVEHEHTGLLVEPGDSEALAQAIERVLRSPDQRQLWGQNARRRVEERFSLDVAAGRTLEVYERAFHRAAQRFKRRGQS